MATKPTKMLGSVESGTKQTEMNSMHYLPNNGMDLSSSNPLVNGHGQPAQTIQNNMLVQGNKHVNWKKQKNKTQQLQHITHQHNHLHQPTYYCDNTQNHQYESSDESSSDFLLNLLLKLFEIFDYKNKINKRNAYHQIFIYASKAALQQNQQQEPSELINESDKKLSVLTFNQNKGTQMFDSPFSSSHSNAPNFFNFNSNIKRKPIHSSSTFLHHCKFLQIPRIQNKKLNIRLNQLGLSEMNFSEHHELPEQLIRMLPDNPRQEVTDELFSPDYYDLPSFSNNSNTPPSNDHQFDDYSPNHITKFKENIELTPLTKVHYINSNINLENHKISERPSPVHHHNESPISRPASYFQAPATRENKVHSKYAMKASELLNDYGQPIRVGKPSKQIKRNVVQITKSFKPAKEEQNHSPFRVNIIYSNNQSRSHSQSIKYSSTGQVHSPESSIQIKIHQSPDHKKINKIKSQYYQTNHYEPVSKLTKNMKIKRMNSSPSSPLPIFSKTSSDFMKKQSNQSSVPYSLRQSIDYRPVTNNPSEEERGKINIESIPTKKSPIKDCSSEFAQTNSNFGNFSTQENEYFEFTRPSKAMNSSSGMSSLKSPKGKKISVISAGLKK